MECNIMIMCIYSIYQYIYYIYRFNVMSCEPFRRASSPFRVQAPRCLNAVRSWPRSPRYVPATRWCLDQKNGHNNMERSKNILWQTTCFPIPRILCDIFFWFGQWLFTRSLLDFWSFRLKKTSGVFGDHPSQKAEHKTIPLVWNQVPNLSSPVYFWFRLYTSKIENKK